MADSIFPIISGNTNLGFVWHVKAKKSPIAQFAPIMKAALIKAPFGVIEFIISNIGIGFTPDISSPDTDILSIFNKSAAFSKTF